MPEPELWGRPSFFVACLIFQQRRRQKTIVCATILDPLWFLSAEQEMLQEVALCGLCAAPGADIVAEILRGGTSSCRNSCSVSWNKGFPDVISSKNLAPSE